MKCTATIGWHSATENLLVCHTTCLSLRPDSSHDTFCTLSLAPTKHTCDHASHDTDFDLAKAAHLRGECHYSYRSLGARNYPVARLQHVRSHHDPTALTLLTMHHALFLPEITCNIFEFLNPFLSEPTASHDRNRLRLQDIAAAATTCHAFSGPALDVLWDTQLCLGPLLMCMSPSVVQVFPSNGPGGRRTIVRDQIFARSV
jgi:hypothetical protein